MAFPGTPLSLTDTPVTTATTLSDTTVRVKLRMARLIRGAVILATYSLNAPGSFPFWNGKSGTFSPRNYTHPLLAGQQTARNQTPTPEQRRGILRNTTKTSPHYTPSQTTSPNYLLYRSLPSVYIKLLCHASKSLRVFNLTFAFGYASINSAANMAGTESNTAS